MKKIDYNKGIKAENMTVDEFNKKHDIMGHTLTGVNTVTVYSFDEVAPRNYCSKHQGVVVVGDEVLEWTEDCNCV